MALVCMHTTHKICMPLVKLMGSVGSVGSVAPWDPWGPWDPWVPWGCSQFVRSVGLLSGMTTLETYVSLLLENPRNEDVVMQVMMLDKNTGICGQGMGPLRWYKVWGYVIFFFILLLMFQAVYDWATYPADLIDLGFSNLADWVKNTLPAGAFTNLLAEGVIAGIGGIMVFIPPIAFLFLFIAILEESGYMSRVVFLMDRIMRRFGLSGKSVVPLISGNACCNNTS